VLEDDLAGCLRAWRDRLAPAAVGLPRQALRRAPGLRREELAGLAGLSPDYLARLEQGRARHPSLQVVSSLARALRLEDDERDHLFRLAGHPPRRPDRISRHLTPGVQRVLDRLTDLPVAVFDAAWELIARNALADALLGELAPEPGRDRNILWRHFTGRPSRVVREDAEDAAFECEMVADLHAALGRYPSDPVLRSLVADLSAASERFRELWDSRPAAVRVSSRKTFEHPAVGRITLDCDVLRVDGSDVRIVIYSPRPGSPDADALALIGVVGLQTLDVAG
jgi:transcriptional regulator with XRE-family HTH domain